MRFALTLCVVLGLLASLDQAPANAATTTLDLRTIPVATTSPTTGPTAGRTADYYLMSRMDAGMVDDLAKYDILVLGLENAVNNRDVLDAIRAKHPAIKILFYMQSNEFPWGGYQNNEPPSGPWHALLASLDTTKHFLLDPTGKPAQFWPGTRSYNLTDQAVPKILGEWIADQFAAYPWDGVFVDNCWTDMKWYCSGNVDADRNGAKDDMAQFSERWEANLTWLGQIIRYRIGTGKLLVGNIGGDTDSNHSFWTPQANGRMFEGFPNTLALRTLCDAYLGPVAWQSPGTTIVHAETNADELDKVRFAWYFTLLGNGAFATDHGPNSGPNGDSGWHDERRWYPELFNAPRGPAVTNAVRLDSGLWLREFDQVVIAWNPMPSPITVNLTLRNGQKLNVTVPAHDGLSIATK